MIKVTNISKSINDIQILEDVSIDIRPGDNIALLGKNGAGKTTFLRILANLVSPDTGSIKIGGRQITSHDISMVGARSESFFSEITAFENLNFFASFHIKDNSRRYELLLKYLRELEIEEKKDQRFSSLSTGEKKKINIVRELIKKPKLLILDELNNSLDLITRDKMQRILKDMLIKNNELAIIHATHHLDDIIGFSNRAVFLQKKKLSEKDIFKSTGNFLELKDILIQNI